MKHLSSIIIVFTLLIFISCQNEVEKTKKNIEISIEKKVIEGDENSTTASMNIEGMTCAMGCAKTIEKKLKALEGVSFAEVDFESKIATVEYDDKLVDENKLLATVNEIHDGQYQVEKMTIEQQVKKSSNTNSEINTNNNSNQKKEELSFNYSFQLPNIFDAITKFYKL
jgi:periplasmic mercuric ion binding protein